MTQSRVSGQWWNRRKNQPLEDIVTEERKKHVIISFLNYITIEQSQCHLMTIFAKNDTRWFSTEMHCRRSKLQLFLQQRGYPQNLRYPNVSEFMRQRNFASHLIKAVNETMTKKSQDVCKMYAPSGIEIRTLCVK